jgi:hypothetical protein
MLCLSSPRENWQNNQLLKKVGLTILPLGRSSGIRERGKLQKQCAQIPRYRGLQSVEGFRSTILDFRMVNNGAGGMFCSGARPRGGRDGAQPNAGLARGPELPAIPQEIWQGSI